MSGEEQKTVIVSGKTVADFGAVIVAIATASSQFLREEKSYEVLFLAFAFLALYGFVKVLMNRVDELKQVLTQIQKRYDRHVQISNATIANLFSDVSQFAGSRTIGTLTVDPESGAMIYIKAPATHAPGGIERRGVPPTDATMN